MIVVISDVAIHITVAQSALQRIALSMSKCNVSISCVSSSKEFAVFSLFAEMAFDFLFPTFRGSQ